MPELPFKNVEPNIWQIPILVLTQALLAYGFNLAGWSVDPVTFFFIPIMLAILFWKRRSFDVISDYLGFNTKNIDQKILASIVGVCCGLSLYMILKYTSLSLIPYATYNLNKLAVIHGISVNPSSIVNSIPIIASFFILYIILLYFETKQISKSALLFMIVTLTIPFLMVYTSPVGVLNMIIGYGEEILCLLFALIAINWLVAKFNMKCTDIKTHILGWVIARASWAVIHALSTYGFVVQAYISAFILGMIFTIFGYMFWFRKLAISVMGVLGILDIYYGIMYSYMIMLGTGVFLIICALIMIVDPMVFRDDSLKFKEYVIYSAAMAHATYDLAFSLFP